MFGGVVRPPWIGPVQACPAEALSDCDLGNLGAMWTHQDLCRVPRVSSEQCRSRTLCHTGASAVAVRSYTYSPVVFGRVVCVRWRPHGCQDSAVLSRTLPCNEMINAYCG